MDQHDTQQSNISPHVYAFESHSSPAERSEWASFGLQTDLPQPTSPELSPTSQASVDGSQPSSLPERSFARARRRVSASGEHVKHRRTRSGCFTCRTRRVKCDEARPVCDRCRKGDRDCKYPEPPPIPKSRRASAKAKLAKEETSSSIEGIATAKERLPSVTDDGGEMQSRSQSGEGTSSPASTPSRREASDPPSIVESKSPASSVDEQGTFAHSARRPSRAQPAVGQAAYRSAPARAPADPQSVVSFYLNFHRHQISAHHYGIRCDLGGFIKRTLLEEAVKYEPLLYAVVAFAAYHHTLTKPQGRPEEFMQFYNKSVYLLRLSLQRNQKQDHSTLLTILQLATVEEYLGDWLNVVFHQRAAYKVLTGLYTPATAMGSETLRKTLLWYQRYDLTAGIISGYETVIGREWFFASHQHSIEQVAKEPANIGYLMEERFASSRLLAYDIAVLMSRKGKGLLTDEEAEAEVRVICGKIRQWHAHIGRELTDERKTVVDWTGAPPPDPDDIVNPYQPHLLYSGDLWEMNYAFGDMWAIEIAFKHQLAMAQHQQLSPDTLDLAYKLCQMFEAIEYYPNKPIGAIQGAQAHLGLACLVLPKDERHISWCRRKFMVVESLGLIYQSSFRARVSALWNEDVSHWWLPNEEGLPPIIKAVREFLERHPTVPRDKSFEDIRDMRALFEGLSVDESVEAESSRSERSEASPQIGAGGFDQPSRDLNLHSPTQPRTYYGHPT